MSMPCPECGKKSSIIDSRAAGDGKTVRRRYECRARHKLRWTTIETIIRLEGNSNCTVVKQFNDQVREMGVQIVRAELADVLRIK